MPEMFDSRNPPFVFTVENHCEIYHRDGRPEIPLALTGSKPCITPDPQLAWLFQNPTCPKSLDDFMQRNVPSVHIHVTVFEDLTFGFIAPHIMIDGIGIVRLLEAWAQLLRGNDIDTIQGMELDAQSLAPFSSGPVESDVPRGCFRPSSPLGLQEMQELTADELDPKDVPRFIRVPKLFLSEANKKITDELKAQGSSEYVGSGDVLTAWWLKTVYGDRSLTYDTPIHMFKNLSGTPIFANDAPLATPYIHNLILTFPVPPVPASAFQRSRLACWHSASGGQLRRITVILRLSAQTCGGCARNPTASKYCIGARWARSGCCKRICVPGKDGRTSGVLLPVFEYQPTVRVSRRGRGADGGCRCGVNGRHKRGETL
ncbi:hypothetical protein C8R45DRAFT_941327 [Mycena sanguinolenta]|nr:hypothetical protein C8R45DRAFT_941327 [Mycena sanguinolenta]